MENVLKHLEMAREAEAVKKRKKLENCFATAWDVNQERLENKLGGE
jgi:hypothetical protein